MRATGRNLSRLHYLETKRKTGTEVTDFLLREVIATGSSEVSKVVEKPLAFVAQGAEDVNPDGREES